MAERRFAGKRNKEKAASVEIMAYRFRGYPDEEAERLLFRNINGCRGFWNILVADGKFMYKTMGFEVDSTPAYKMSRLNVQKILYKNVQLVCLL